MNRVGHPPQTPTGLRINPAGPTRWQREELRRVAAAAVDARTQTSSNMTPMQLLRLAVQDPRPESRALSRGITEGATHVLKHVEDNITGPMTMDPPSSPDPRPAPRQSTWHNRLRPSTAPLFGGSHTVPHPPPPPRPQPPTTRSAARPPPPSMRGIVKYDAEKWVALVQILGAYRHHTAPGSRGDARPQCLHTPRPFAHV